MACNNELIRTGAEFLDFLEATRDSRNELPLRYLMQRIKRILTHLLSRGHSLLNAGHTKLNEEEEHHQASQREISWFRDDGSRQLSNYGRRYEDEEIQQQVGQSHVRRWSDDRKYRLLPKYKKRPIRDLVDDFEHQRSSYRGRSADEEEQLQQQQASHDEISWFTDDEEISWFTDDEGPRTSHVRVCTDDAKYQLHPKYERKPAWDPVEDFKDGIKEIVASRRSVYLDVQMLYDEEGPVIKEFSASCRGCLTVNIIVKAPNEFRQRVPGNEYAIAEVHGMTWDMGLIDEDELKRITNKLFDGTRRVYVKGSEKRDALVKRLGLRPNVLENVRTKAKYTDLVRVFSGYPCPYHKFTNMKCAMRHSEVLLAYSVEELNCNSYF